jgi:hypothetical protein
MPLSEQSGRLNEVYHAEKWDCQYTLEATPNGNVILFSPLFKSLRLAISAKARSLPVLQ